MKLVFGITMSNCAGNNSTSCYFNVRLEVILLVLSPSEIGNIYVGRMEKNVG